VPGGTVLVVRENPSLASALADLFQADGLTVSTVRSLEELGHAPEGPVSRQSTIVVVASKGFESPTTREWATGKWSGTDLVLIGARDPGLRSRGRFHVVRLPLVPKELLRLIRSLLDGLAPSPDAIAPTG
jgi:hypothetical protein